MLSYTRNYCVFIQKLYKNVIEYNIFIKLSKYDVGRLLIRSLAPVLLYIVYFTYFEGRYITWKLIKWFNREYFSKLKNINYK